MGEIDPGWAQLLNGGGLALFATAVLVFVRDMSRSMRRIERTLVAMETRDSVVAEVDKVDTARHRKPRKRVRTPPLGVPIRQRTVRDTDEGDDG